MLFGEVLFTGMTATVLVVRKMVIVSVTVVVMVSAA